MLAILKSRSFLVFIGLLILALLIWFAGPYFAFADHRPLESVVARLVAIIVVFAIWAVIVQIKMMKSNRASAKLATEVAGQESGRKSGEGADAAQLRKRFEEAVDALKKSRTRGARNLYELPWYIIIGPPGSGKTTALVNSGLNFPLAQKFGKEALRGVGGTRNCDWWFTDDAILLDTAGRYTTQDSNESADAAGWTSFLQLLRKYRSRQPINGVLVAISASDLLTLNEREREKHVVAIRERLEELNRHLKISAPVYFLVTKCDLIAGFSEFFDDFGQEARAQVWGMTFPIEATESGRAVDAFEGEFDGLLDRLQSRVLTRLEQDRDTRRRATMLAFPQQAALLKPLLGDLLKRVFGASGYDSKVLLRGVYFTSGTQEGTPIDRMLGAIARSFGFTSAVSAAAPGQGKSYFIQRLLKDVIFAESGLAGINRRLQLQKIFLQSFAYIACVALLVLGVTLLIISYSRNSSYIADVEKSANGLAALEPARGVEQPVETYLPHLKALRDVVHDAAVHEGDVPWTMRFGLYRGKALTSAAHDAYVRELNAILVPIMAHQFEERLRSNAQAPDKLYEYLKGYLMLGDSSHRNLSHLKALVSLVLGQLLGRDPQAREEVDQHFAELLTDKGTIQASVVNQDLVDQARYSLRTASLPFLMYSRLKQNYAFDEKRAVRLDVELGAGADAALARKSPEKLGSTVPAIYTRGVFQEINGTGKYAVVKDFAEDQWVFGGKLFELTEAGRYAFDVMRVYEQDYIAFWDRQVADVQIRPTANSQELTDVLGILASPTSPLKRFLEIVADNTNLLKVDAKDALDKAEDKLTKQGTDALARTLDIKEPADALKPGAECTAHFAAIRKLVEGPPGGTQLDRVQGVLKEMHTKLKTTGTGVGDTNPLDIIAGGGGDTLQSIQLEAKQLPPPLNEMMSKIGGQSESVVEGGARDELIQRYNQMVSRQCRELIEGRYPFSRGSGVDVPLGDFGQVFGGGGVFDVFFRENLKSLVDTTRTPWKWREGAPAGSASMLRQFQTVERIREVFFRSGSQTPEVRFNIAPDTLDASVARFSMDVDGQLFEYRHGPQQSRSIVWPGNNGVGEASVTFEDRSGTGPSLRFKGPWALFRLLDQATVTRDSDTSFSVAFAVEGRSAQVTLDANSVRNPFARADLLRFRCSM
jgi:type VI secretion system protein ImpL